MKILSIGAVLIHADGRTEMTKLIGACRYFAKGPKLDNQLTWFCSFMHA